MSEILDIIVVIVVLFVFGLASIFAYSVFDDVNTDITNDENMASEAQAISSDLFGNFDTLFDNLFLFLFVLISLVTVVSVFLLDTQPVFFIFSLILLVAVFVIAALLGNSFEEVVSDNSIASYANNFPKTSWILHHLVEEIIIIALLVAVALYAKSKV